MDRFARLCSGCCKAMATRLVSVTVIALLLFCTTQAAMKISLNHILAHQQHQSPHQLFHKRNNHLNRPDDDNTENKLAGNPCIDYPDHPFPCKNTKQCLPFNYICDKNFDCADESDEDPEMCTASKRPPIDEIKLFLDKEKDWLVTPFFPKGLSTERIAQGLAVNPSVEDLRYYLNMSDEQLFAFEDVLRLVRENRDDEFIALGMPPGDWPEVQYMLMALLDTGFDNFDYY